MSQLETGTSTPVLVRNGGGGKEPPAVPGKPVPWWPLPGLEMSPPPQALGRAGFSATLAPGPTLSLASRWTPTKS